MEVPTCSDLAEALAREQSSSYKSQIIASILGLVLVFWLAMYIFITLNFCKPFRLPVLVSERNRNAEDDAIELNELGNAEQQQQQQGSRLFWARRRQ